MQVSTSIITTVAGNGTNGYSGDGGPATDAEMYYATAIGVDVGGNIYILSGRISGANNQNNCGLRKVDATTGNIYTIAGDNAGNTDGILSASNPSPLNNCGYKGDNNPATSAELNPGYSASVAIDKLGNIYVPDSNSDLVRAISQSPLSLFFEPLPGAGNSGTVNPTQGIYLTQGYNNTNDPFFFVAINMVLNSQGGANYTLPNSCAFYDPSTNPTTNILDPSCAVGNSTVTVSASSSAPIGVYNATFTATDPNETSLFQSTQLAVYVVGLTTLTLKHGGVGQTGSVTFNTATPPSGTTPTTLVSIACGAIIDSNSTTRLPLTTTTVTCYSPQSTVVTGQQTIVPITVVVVKSQPTAQIQRPNHIYAAAFLGIPILALMGCFGRKNSPRKNFFRYLGLILLLVGVSYTTGCGRGFTWPPPQGNQGGLDPGDYLIQVTATDQTGTQKYYAALQLHVPTE